jgi:hypothetical protein
MNKTEGEVVSVGMAAIFAVRQRRAPDLPSDHQIHESGPRQPAAIERLLANPAGLAQGRDFDSGKGNLPPSHNQTPAVQNVWPALNDVGLRNGSCRCGKQHHKEAAG